MELDPKVLRVLNAAVNSMMHGHHYPRDMQKLGVGSDYFRRLEGSARWEIKRLRYAPHYSEPGYELEKGKKGILLMDWDWFPRGLTSILARLGYDTKSKLDWYNCDNCWGALRQSGGNTVHIQLAFQFVSLCRKCADEYNKIESSSSEDLVEAIIRRGREQGGSGEEWITKLQVHCLWHRAWEAEPRADCWKMPEDPGDPTRYVPWDGRHIKISASKCKE